MNSQHIDLRAKWPQERTLARYAELVGFDIRHHLSSGGIWIDVGCGKGVALSELLGHSQIELVGVTPVQIETDPSIRQINSLIPSDKELLQTYLGKARMTSDIFGALSYCEDPLEALIYESLLLRRDGVAVFATRPERFGQNSDVRCRIETFFAQETGRIIEFGEIETISDATGKPVGVLQVRLHSSSHSSAPTRTLESLLESSRSIVGVPKKVRPAWTSEDQKVQIWEVDFIR